MLTKKPLYRDSHDCLTLYQMIHMLIYFHLVDLNALAPGYIQRDNENNNNTATTHQPTYSFLLKAQISFFFKSRNTAGPYSF